MKYRIKKKYFFSDVDRVYVSRLSGNACSLNKKGCTGEGDRKYYTAKFREHTINPLNTKKK